MHRNYYPTNTTEQNFITFSTFSVFSEYFALIIILFVSGKAVDSEYGVFSGFFFGNKQNKSAELLIIKTDNGNDPSTELDYDKTGSSIINTAGSFDFNEISDKFIQLNNIINNVENHLETIIKTELEIVKYLSLKIISSINSKICDYKLIIKELINKLFVEEIVNRVDLRSFNILYSLFYEEFLEQSLPLYRFKENLRGQLMFFLNKEKTNTLYLSSEFLSILNFEISGYWAMIDFVKNNYFPHGILDVTANKYYDLFLYVLRSELSAEIIPFKEFVENVRSRFTSLIVGEFSRSQKISSKYMSSLSNIISEFNISKIKNAGGVLLDDFQNSFMKFKSIEKNIEATIFRVSQETPFGKLNTNFNKFVSPAKDDSTSRPLKGLTTGKSAVFLVFQSDSAAMRKENIIYSKDNVWSCYGSNTCLSGEDNRKEKRKNIRNSDQQENYIKNGDPNFPVLLISEDKYQNERPEMSNNIPPLILSYETEKMEEYKYPSLINQKSSLSVVNNSNSLLGLCFTGSSKNVSINIHSLIDKFNEDETASEKIFLNLPDLNLCNVTDTILDAGNPNSHYLWSTGEKTQRIRVNKTGVYYVTVTKGKNKAIDSSYITINSKPRINLPDYTVICQGDDICLNAGGGNYNYSWSTGATTTSIFVYQKGTYYVDVSNECGAIRDYSTVLISDSCNSSSYKIPEIFTPNGDGETDSFIFDIKDLIFAKTTIFNLSGIKIYENYGSDKYWDGKIGDKKAADGNYYYIIYAKLKTYDMEFRGKVRLKR